MYTAVPASLTVLSDNRFYTVCVSLICLILIDLSNTFKFYHYNRNARNIVTFPKSKLYMDITLRKNYFLFIHVHSRTGLTDCFKWQQIIFFLNRQHRHLGHGFRFLLPPLGFPNQGERYGAKYENGVAYLLSYTVSVEKMWTQNTRIIHDVWRLLYATPFSYFAPYRSPWLGNPSVFDTFYLVYIWHCRIKLFLRHLPNCPCSNFSLYVFFICYLRFYKVTYVVSKIFREKYSERIWVFHCR
jgi:hypothetical protein